MSSESVAAPSRKRRIYIAGPLRGNETTNVRAAIIAADVLLWNGYAVFCPHLNVLHDLLHPRSAEEWIEHDLVWLKVCDAVLRLSGESEGADIEVASAKAAGIPVFTFIDDILRDLPTWVPETAHREGTSHPFDPRGQTKRVPPPPSTDAVARDSQTVASDDPV